MKTIRPYLFKLFILISFPVHLWSIFQNFQNIGWIAERTTWADALGYFSYTLMIALVESFLVFLFALPIFLLLARIQPPKKALAITTLTYFTVAALWIFRSAMINKTADPFFLDSFINNLGDQNSWRLRHRYLAVLTAIIILNIPVVLVPLLTIKREAMTRFLLSVLDRIETLMYLFFGLDLISIVVIIVRNILGAL